MMHKTRNLLICIGRQCCAGQQDANCWPIQIFNNDPFYARVSRPQTCMDFTRSTAFCFPTNSGVREQMNMNTAYIDGSQVYASNPQRSQQLRQLTQGWIWFFYTAFSILRLI